MFVRTIWNSQTYREITEIIQREKPDVVHCHNTFPLISPSVYWAAARQSVPIVQTLHNYRLICINPYLYRNGKICEDCVGHSPIPGVIHRCYRGSLSASFTVAAMLMIHRLLGTYRNKVTTYIALTEFGRQKFLEAKLCSPTRVVVKPNAVAPSSTHAEDAQELGARGEGLADARDEGLGVRVEGRQDDRNDSPASELGPMAYGLTPISSPDQKSKIKNQKSLLVLYAGRLSPEKGPHLLLEAWRLLVQQHSEITSQHQLVIAGEGPERQNLETMAKTLPTVLFTGQLSREKLHVLMAEAKVLVLPSTCYETFAMSVNEAAALGTPSIVSDIGGQASLVEDGITGYTFESGSSESLAAVLKKALADPDRLAHLSAAARERFHAGDCPPEKNVTALCLAYAHVCPPSGHTQVKLPPACGPCGAARPHLRAGT